jgi:hypothetical protein
MGSSSTNLNTTTAATTDSKVQVVEDEPIPPMYLPGKIVHIYSYRGTYRAAIVPCDHPSLRRIEVRKRHEWMLICIALHCFVSDL